MTENEVDKKVLKSIKRQLEFYFSEGNLPRDEFMQKCIKASQQNSILIADLLKFNKLIELNATEELITLAVNKSKLLKFDDANEGIKRKIELDDLKPVDTRTIFVCGFLNEDNQKSSADEVAHELKKKFKGFGKILRIDLPKYGSSNELRGFGFIEFLTKTAARNALSEHKCALVAERKADSWKHFSFSNSQYSHALKQLELLGQPQKLFFDDVIGDQRKDKAASGSPARLSVISKKEWLTFRTQFYGAQQSHLAQMRTLIAQHSTAAPASATPTGASNSAACSHKLHERVKADIAPAPVVQQPTISCGSVVAFQVSENCTKKLIKEALSQLAVLANVVYIDYRDFQLDGHLRFSSGDGAAAFIAAVSRDDSQSGPLVAHSCRVLSQEEERHYLDKMLHDKDAKKESQKRKNCRQRKRKLMAERDE